MTASGQPIRLTRAAAFYRDPVWSPDGKRIVALRAPRRERVENPVDFGPSSGLDLVWVSADGGDSTTISPARGASRPHFAGDPDRIYVTTPQGLVSMRFDGTDRRTHLQVTGKTAYRPTEPEPPRRSCSAPTVDGSWHASPTQLYLLALPRFGGEAPKVSVHEPSVPIKKLTDIGADYAAWSDGGKMITWAIGSSLFRLPFDSVVFPPLKSRRRSKDADKEKAEAEEKARSPSPKRSAWLSSGRGTGRAARSCSEGRASSR